MAIAHFQRRDSRPHRHAAEDRRKPRQRTPRFKVTVRGKPGAVQALGELGGFEEAVAENHARPGDAAVGLYYGLSSVGANLMELHTNRP